MDRNIERLDEDAEAVRAFYADAVAVLQKESVIERYNLSLRKFCDAKMNRAFTEKSITSTEGYRTGVAVEKKDFLVMPKPYRKGHYRHGDEVTPKQWAKIATGNLFDAVDEAYLDVITIPEMREMVAEFLGLKADVVKEFDKTPSAWNNEHVEVDIRDVPSFELRKTVDTDIEGRDSKVKIYAKEASPVRLTKINLRSRLDRPHLWHYQTPASYKKDKGRIDGDWMRGGLSFDLFFCTKVSNADDSVHRVILFNSQESVKIRTNTDTLVSNNSLIDVYYSYRYGGFRVAPNQILVRPFLEIPEVQKMVKKMLAMYGRYYDRLQAIEEKWGHLLLRSGNF